MATLTHKEKIEAAKVYVINRLRIQRPTSVNSVVKILIMDVSITTAFINDRNLYPEFEEFVNELLIDLEQKEEDING